MQKNPSDKQSCCVGLWMQAKAAVDVDDQVHEACLLQSAGIYAAAPVHAAGASEASSSLCLCCLLSAMHAVTCELQHASLVGLILSVHSWGAQCTPAVDADDQWYKACMLWPADADAAAPMQAACLTAASSSLAALPLPAMHAVTCKLQHAGFVGLILSVHSWGAQCTPGVDADDQWYKACMLWPADADAAPPMQAACLTAASSSLAALPLPAMHAVTCKLQHAGFVGLILSVHSWGAQCTPGVDAEDQWYKACLLQPANADAAAPMQAARLTAATSSLLVLLFPAVRAVTREGDPVAGRQSLHAVASRC